MVERRAAWPSVKEDSRRRKSPESLDASNPAYLDSVGNAMIHEELSEERCLPCVTLASRVSLTSSYVCSPW
jgi:hypothetical protein